MPREPAATDEIVRRCAGLPLALAVAAARAAAAPFLSARALLEDLQEAERTIDVLAGWDAATNLRTVLSWSYQRLSPGAATLFQLLGRIPGGPVSAHTLGSLAGLPIQSVRRLLAELAHANVIDEAGPSRYRLHDLLREYAAELSHNATPNATPRAAAQPV